MKLLYTCIFYAVIFSSCMGRSGKTDQNSLEGTWRLYDISSSKTGGGKSFENEAELKKKLNKGELLCLFKDGSYSNFKGDGEYINGNWKLFHQGKSISFTNSNSGLTPITFNMEKNLEGRLILTLFEDNEEELKFIKQSEPLKEFQNDPYYIANNQWRIKPDQPEDDPELSNRLSNYIKHLALILKAAKETNQSVVSFEFSMGPVKIYNGGIGIHYYEDVPETWKNYFYDYTDASSAYDKYENFLKASRYKGAGSGNWIDDDYNILLSIFSDITE